MTFQPSFKPLPPQLLHVSEEQNLSPPTFREEHQSHRRSAQLKHLGMDYHLWLWPKRFISGKKASKLPMLPEIQQQNPEVPWFSSQNITKILANIQQLGMLSCFHLSSSFHLRKWGLRDPCCTSTLHQTGVCGTLVARCTSFNRDKGMETASEDMETWRFQAAKSIGFGGAIHDLEGGTLQVLRFSKV